MGEVERGERVEKSREKREERREKREQREQREKRESEKARTIRIFGDSNNSTVIVQHTGLTTQSTPIAGQKY